MYKQIENGTFEYANEMRFVSVVFIQICGVDVSTDEGLPCSSFPGPCRLP